MSAHGIDFPTWLKSHQLEDDIVNKLHGNVTLAGLLLLDDENLRSILNLFGLNHDQMSRTIQALDTHKHGSQPGGASPSNHTQNTFTPDLKEEDDENMFTTIPVHDSSPKPNMSEMRMYDDNMDIEDEYVPVYHDDDIKQPYDDGEHPVIPLFYPNNATYDPQTGEMNVDMNAPRDKLVIYKPALEFIRSIKSKIATISIVGRARTGKSLIAGELYAPGKIPCAFDLGHKMDACTYGVWVSAKEIKHPYEQDTVILIFDVEGTGYYDAKKQTDMQLMVITLLISSYFIYNTKGTFDAPALDEIRFVTELTDKIQSSPNDDSGEEFSKFFPVFMWLLRDVHLEAVINDKQVSVKQYFQQKVLKKQRGMSKKIQDRQWIQTVFLQMFQKYDAFALPMPHADKYVLQKLGDCPRNELNPAFNKGLQEFCDLVLKETKNKVLFAKKSNGEDHFIHCQGSHLAAWIEQCVESVNDPDKVPHISSMTEAVMANVFRVTKAKSVNEYKQLMMNQLKALRNNDDQQPLDEQQIMDSHLQIVDHILQTSGTSLQPPQSAASDNNASDLNRQQLAVFHEFCDEIGHNQNAADIGQSGIMYSILNENKQLSMRYCNHFLQKHYSQSIEPMLKNPKQHTAKVVIDTFEKLEEKFHAHCKGPAKHECWQEFKSKTMQQSLQQFKKLKGFSDTLLKKEEENAAQREQTREMMTEVEKQRLEFEQQQQLMKDEMKRIEEIRRQEANDHAQQLRDAEERMRNMQQSQFNELAKSFQESNAEMNNAMMSMQDKNSQDMKEMFTMMNSTLEAIKNQPPPEVRVVETSSGGGCLIM